MTQKESKIRFQFVEQGKVYKLDINGNDESGVNRKDLLFGEKSGYMKKDFFPIETVRDLLNTFFPGRSADTKDIKPFTTMTDSKGEKSMVIKSTTVLHIPGREIPITVDLISTVSAGKLWSDDTLYGFNGNIQARGIKTAAKQLGGIFNIKEMFSDVSEQNKDEKIEIIDDINGENIETVETVDKTQTVEKIEETKQMSDEINKDEVIVEKEVSQGKEKHEAITAEELYQKFVKESVLPKTDPLYKKTIARLIGAELLTNNNILPSSEEGKAIVMKIKEVCGL